MIRILLADDHTIFREGIKLIFEEVDDITIAGEARDGNEALSRILHETWDLVLMDISMPGKSALEVLKRVRSTQPSLPVIILTMHDDELLALRFLKAGANGYLTKDCDPAILVEAVRTAMAGRRYISSDMAECILESWGNDVETPPHETLSDREFNVLCQIAAGRTVTQIATDLGLSPRTVSTYRSRVLEKMKLKTNSELTHYALKNGLVG